MENFSFKKFFIVIGIFAGAIWYVRSHYTLQDVLVYAKKQPDLGTGPKLEYYAAMAYYTSREYESAAKAFEQLLERCATCHAYTSKALLRSGDSYEYLKNWQGARGAYEKYIELYPDGPDKNLVSSKYDLIKFKD